MSISLSAYSPTNEYFASPHRKKDIASTSWEEALLSYKPTSQTDKSIPADRASISHSNSLAIDPASGSNNWSPKVQAAYQSLGVDLKYYDSDKEFLSKASENFALELIEQMRKYVDYETIPIDEVRQVDMGNHQDYRAWLHGWTNELEGWLESGVSSDPVKLKQGETALNFLKELIVDESKTPAMTDDYGFLSAAIGSNPKPTMAAALDATFFQHLGLDGDSQDIFGEVFSSSDGAERLVENLYKARFDVGESNDGYVSNLQHRHPGHRTLGNLQAFNWETGEPLPSMNPAIACAFAERLGTPFKRDHEGKIDYFARSDLEKVPATFSTNEMKRAETDQLVDKFSSKNKNNDLAQSLAKTMRDYFRDIYRIG